MKIALNVIGGLLVLIGIFWILAGLNMLPGYYGGFATAKLEWAAAGLLTSGTGTTSLIIVNRRRTDKQPAKEKAAGK